MTDRNETWPPPTGPAELALLFAQVHQEALATVAGLDDAEVGARLAALLAPLDGHRAPAALDGTPVARDGTPVGAGGTPSGAAAAGHPGGRRPRRARSGRWRRPALLAAVAAVAVGVVVVVDVVARSGDPVVAPPAGPSARRVPAPSQVSAAGAPAICSSASKAAAPPSWLADQGISFSGEVAYSPDGRSIVSVSVGPARVYDAGGTVRRTLAESPHGSAYAVAFTPDSRDLLLGHRDGAVTVQDLASGKAVCTLTGHRDAVDGLAYAPDGRTLASAGRDGTARIWDVASGHERHVITVGRAVDAVAYSPDAATVVTVTGGGATAVWDVATGAKVRDLAAAAGPNDQASYDVAFSPDGRTVVRVGDSGLASWDAATGKALHVLPEDGAPYFALAFSPDGTVLAATRGDDTVVLWDTATGAEVRSFKAGSTTTADGIAFAPDGTRFATLGGMEGTLRTWKR